MEEGIKLEISREIVRIKMNRPDVYNAFNMEMVKSLAEMLINIAMDPLMDPFNASLESQMKK